MSKQPTISRMALQIGDKIAFDYAAQDVDMPDSTIWMTITDVVFEDGYRGYKVSYPDGEPSYNTVLAKHVSKFKTAADFAIDDHDVPKMEAEWKRLMFSTAKHEWYCDCKDCMSRRWLGLELTDIYHREFIERAERIEAARSRQSTIAAV
jgi:hypothetical protein